MRLHPFDMAPCLASKLDEWEALRNLREILELSEHSDPEPCSQLSDEDDLPTPHPATVADWRDA